MTEKPKNEIKLIIERCKGCRFCVEFCPQHILYQSDEVNSKGYRIVDVADISKCDQCNTCSMVCPEFAINVVSIEAKPVKDGEVVCLSQDT
ncbi:MAG: 4Fe-4S dicluster domain-containing protein [Chloroflexi bacterium]|nr:4Fe-4S dicluster domain-containing protein [Chloroflexota bacterium]